MFKDGTALNPGTDSSSMMTAFTSDKLGLVLTSSASYTSLLPGDSTSNVTVAQFPHDASNKKAGTRSAASPCGSWPPSTPRPSRRPPGNSAST